MAYTTIDDPSEYFTTLLYTGNATDNRNLTNSAGLLQAGYSKNIDVDSHLKNINFFFTIYYVNSTCISYYKLIEINH